MLFSSWTSENGPQEINQNSSWCEWQRVLGWCSCREHWCFPEWGVWKRIFPSKGRCKACGKILSSKIVKNSKCHLFQSSDLSCIFTYIEYLLFSMGFTFRSVFIWSLVICLCLWSPQGPSLPHLLPSCGCALHNSLCLPFSRSLLSHQACILNVAAV